MKRFLAIFMIIMLVTPKFAVSSPDGPRITVSETVVYVAEMNPLTGNWTLEYKSTITVKNEGAPGEYRFTQRIVGVNASTLELPKEARVSYTSGEICLVEWIIHADHGLSIFEVRGKPTWVPLSFDVNMTVNGIKPVYSSAYGIFFVSCGENNTVSWRMRLKNNNPTLLDPETNISSKPPLFVSVSITLPGKYFGDVVYDPPANMTSPLEKDTVSWMLILKEYAEVSVEAVVRGFDEWGTIPLMPISISFSPMEDSVRESISSQLKSLNMSMEMIRMILSPLGNFTDFLNLMRRALENLSYGLEATGNQTIMMSDALKKIGSELGYATSQLSQAASLLSTVMENVSKVDFNRIRRILKSSRQTARDILNRALDTIVDAENDLLEIREILIDLRSNLTDPDQITLLNRAIERIDNLYNDLRNFEDYLRSAESQLDSLFDSIESFVNTLENYRSKIMSLGSGLSAGVLALSEVSSALYEVSSALRLIGGMNIMMSENVTSIVCILENSSSGLMSIRESLDKNMTSLKKAYDELYTFLRLMDYDANRIKLLAPELGKESSITLQPQIINEEGFTKFNSLVSDNDVKIGIRTIKVYYNGTFQGIVLNNSKILTGLPELGISISEGCVTIKQFRLQNKGNILKIWNGQEISLLFSNNSSIMVSVDYSAVDNLGERSEALSFSIIQPTLGKGFSTVVKPVEETPPLKTGLNILTLLLAVTSVIIAVILLYAFSRRKEVILI
jgi:predicted component of type VI protein secretion system